MTQEGKRFRWRRLGMWLVGLVVVLPVASFGMNSLNEATPADAPVVTRIGDYTSTEPMGWFPLSLLRALNKFADANACLTTQALDNGVPRWADMETEEQLKVCVFWIAKKIGSIEEVKIFFERNGITVSTNRNVNESNILYLNNKYVNKKMKNFQN